MEEASSSAAGPSRLSAASLQPPRPDSAMSAATSVSSAASSTVPLRERREVVSHLSVSVPPPASTPDRPSSRSSQRQVAEDHGSRSSIDEPRTRRKSHRSSGEGSGSNEWVSHRPPSRGAGVSGLGLALGLGSSQRDSIAEDDDWDDDDMAGRLAPEEDAIVNRPPLSSGLRNWGDEDFDLDSTDARSTDGSTGDNRDAAAFYRRPSAATFRSTSSSYTLGAGGGPADEWRNRILEGVRRGEERAAERRRRAGTTSTDAGNTPSAGRTSLPPLPDEIVPPPPDEPPPPIDHPSFAADGQALISDNLRPPQASLDLPLPPSPGDHRSSSTMSPTPSFTSNLSSSALLPPHPPASASEPSIDYNGGDLANESTAAASRADVPPQVDGTFISVADPSFLLRSSQLDEGRSTSPASRRTGRNFISQLFHRSTGNTTPHRRTTSTTANGNFSQPSTPAVAQRNAGTGLNTESSGMTRSASEGASLARPPFDRSEGSQSTMRAGVSHRMPEEDGLDSLGVELHALTPAMSSSRYAQPLCGAILDQKYLLIGTSAGLDFIPLQKVVTSKTGGVRRLDRPIKPISLIKKTRIKDLAVLERRSNILLAIAGRNDHLRVYALDGIRAMIEKKVSELGGKDDFVFVPKAFVDPRRTFSTSSSKGKGRAPTTPTLVNGSSTSPPNPSASNTIPNGLPPPYKAPPGNDAPLPKSPTLQPVVHPPVTPSRPTAHSPLRRASTLRETSTAAVSLRNEETRRARPTSVPASPVAASNPFQSNDERAVELGLTRDQRDAEHDENAHEGVGSGSSSNEMERPDESTAGSALTARTKLTAPHEAVSASGSVAALAEALQERGAGPKSEKGLLSPLAPRRARMSPRSPVSRREDTDEETSGDEASPNPTAATRRGLSLADMLAEGPPGSNANGPAMRHRATTDGSLAAPRTRLQPRSPLIQPPMDEGDSDDDVASPQSRRPSMTLAEMLSEEPPATFNDDRPRSQMPARDQSSRSLPSDQASPNTSRTRKRWSVFRGGGNMTPSTSSPELAPRRATATGGVERSGSQPELSSKAAGSPLSDAPSTSPDPMGTTAASSAPNRLAPPPMRTRPSTQKLRPTPEGALNPEERAAEGLVNGVNTDEAHTSPHPATLGAPLEYVKLARTKGARLLRAVETNRRTYLAVLCGDNGERVELFTGSKNISLSLNRTFVLPETPRTIEFQMQGDDLVDIYLVYDESIFALEPATVRVREVGIGRNERRAARRERERLAREGASTNLRPPNVARPSAQQVPLPRTPTTSFGLGILNTDENVPSVPARRNSLQPQTVIEATSSASAAAPRQPDDGLTLAPPTPPQTARTSANVSADATPSRPRTETSPTTDGSATSWPYTMFQQLSFTPPLPASVLASTYVIPPSYDAVVSASTNSTPALLQPSIMGASINGTDAANSPVNVQLRSSGDADLADDIASPDPGTGGPPLLSPVSLLAPSSTRPSGPPGLFWISRGRKISSIVDCDGRSVLKRPFLWQSRDSQPEDVTLGLRRLEVLIVGRKRPVVIGFNTTAVRAFEVGGLRAGGEGDDWSNAAPVEVAPIEAKGSGAGQPPREVTYLGFSKGQNEVVWAERAGGNFGIFSLSSGVR